MELQDKGLNNIGKKVESKEGEREPLSCHRANVRSPSLEFNNNAPLISEKIQLDFLAKMLVDIFLERKRYERRQQKESGDLLPRINEGAG